MLKEWEKRIGDSWSWTEQRKGGEMYGRLGVAVAMATLIGGCGAVDTMKEGFVHAQAVSKDLEKGLGVKPFVGFSWHNGSLTSVSVRFQGIPGKVTLADIAAQSKQAVMSEFKQTPGEIVVSFALEP